MGYGMNISMKKVLILLVLSCLTLEEDFGFESYAPDGKGTHKQQVYITNSDGFGNAYECSGVMLTESIALTAGHCVNPRFSDSDIKVSLPKRKCEKMVDMTQDSGEIEACKIVDKYSGKYEIEHHRGPTAADIALIKLAQPMPGMETMKMADSALSFGENATLYGTGQNSEGSPCESFFSSQTRISCVEYSQWICLRGSNGFGTACSGDSGGPIVSEKNEIVGIVSTVSKFFLPECAPGTTVASNVAFYKRWIQQQLEEILGQCPTPSIGNQIWTGGIFYP